MPDQGRKRQVHASMFCLDLEGGAIILCLVPW